MRKAVFDTIRQILGRGFTQGEVSRLDRALDCAIDDTACTARHQFSPEGLALIKRFEGCARIRADGRIEAYPDPGTGGAPWTIGWGATGPEIGPGTIWTQAQCDDRLERDTARFAAEVAHTIGDCPTRQNQFDALVSFHYNTGAIARATLTRMHCAGDFEGAAQEFARWNKAGGRVLAGLSRRRAAEAELYSRRE
ncbi:lysozyme [Altericroceibacterium endophyticum]|uniref:Lysozyme n=1 Tax=Altericroceibacterium endophyticum TaxID=1808508 RepID=A0A6I4T8A0_9SPHN|nr:lysozyme [Altericroceibacterium endophyticum]MXO66482.1 glycoside hydrolase family protein [Altericroceibacterium endophyticum]